MPFVKFYKCMAKLVLSFSHLVHERLGLGQIAHTRIFFRRDSSSVVFALGFDSRHLDVEHRRRDRS